MSDTFDTIAELRDALLKDMRDAVIREVVKELKDIEKEVIEEKVYAVFSPKEYERRYEKSGIGDTKNMIEEVRVFANEIVIEITNLTSGNSKYRNYWQGEIQPLIEEGNYMWNGKMPPPRPFIDEAQSIVDNTDRIYNVIMKVLRKYGW